MSSIANQKSRAVPRAVLVTGGSSGVGAAFCRAAAARGWHVWIGFDRGAERAEALAEEIRRKEGAATPVRLPLDEPETLAEAVARTAAVAGSEALVLCGGAAPDIQPLVKTSAGQVRRQVEIGIVGNHALIAAAWRHCFRPRGGGHVLAVLTAALGPPAASHMSGYVAAKGGLQALLHAAASELGAAGLRVTALSPGYVETPMLSAFDPRLVERARQAMPDGRFLAPGEVASVLVDALEAPPEPGVVRALDLPQPVGLRHDLASA